MARVEKRAGILRMAFRVLLLATLVIQLCGCVAAVVGAGAGVGTYAYISGKLKYDFDHSVLYVHRATKEALEDMKLPIYEDRSDKLSAVLKSKFADGDEINISMESLSDRSSSISIRVGIFGNEKKSLSILEEIKRHI
ncbi:MAG: DUF3568 family protein [Nitrospirae bacterium]|nr:DUF3568 family protein [Nitrospirota bacterium]